MDADTVDSKHASDFVLTTDNTASAIATKIFDLLYPVGSIVEFATNADPNELSGWKGTWTQIKDKFTLAAGDIYDAGDTGGSATHTLIASEMPVHKHDVAVPSSGQATTPSGGNGTTGSDGDHTHPVNLIQNAPTSGGAIRVTTKDQGNATSSTITESAGAHTHSTPAHTHTVPNHAHTVSESNKGSGAAHNNMPPYVVVYKWVRTA
jgi:microcystin-dependent protein